MKLGDNRGELISIVCNVSQEMRRTTPFEILVLAVLKQPLLDRSLFEKCSFYTRVQDFLSIRPWFSHFSHFSRKTIISIFCFRFGDDSLPANLSKFIPSISPYCPQHPEINTQASLNHIFLQCPKLTSLGDLNSPFHLYAPLNRGPWRPYTNHAESFSI